MDSHFRDVENMLESWKRYDREHDYRFGIPLYPKTNTLLLRIGHEATREVQAKLGAIMQGGIVSVDGRDVLRNALLPYIEFTHHDVEDLLNHMGIVARGKYT